jgi:hypothetical protein
MDNARSAGARTPALAGGYPLSATWWAESANVRLIIIRG